MPDLDLDRIEALADAATPGEWHAVRHYIGAGDDPTDPHTEVANVSFLNDAEFIAGTGPDVVKELVRQLREARAGQADAWAEGVSTALNHAIRNEDGITLRLEHLDGRPWANPYRSDHE